MSDTPTEPTEPTPSEPDPAEPEGETEGSAEQPDDH